MTATAVRDLHPDDTSIREDFHRQLADLRRAAGLTHAQLGERVGLKAAAVGEFERRRNPLLVNAQKYPAAYGLRLTLKLVGLPEPAPDDPSPGILAKKAKAATTPHERWAAERRWLIATLRAIREGAGISQRELADVCDLTQHAMVYLEKAPHGMLLWSAQRYARALGIATGTGGHLDLRIEAPS